MYVQVSVGCPNTINGEKQTYAVDIMIVDYPNGNPVTGCLDGLTTPEWNVFKSEYWNYTFGLADSLLQDNVMCSLHTRIRYTILGTNQVMCKVEHNVRVVKEVLLHQL